MLYFVSFLKYPAWLVLETFVIEYLISASCLRLKEGAIQFTGELSFRNILVTALIISTCKQASSYTIPMWWRCESFSHTAKLISYEWVCGFNQLIVSTHLSFPRVLWLLKLLSLKSNCKQSFSTCWNYFPMDRKNFGMDTICHLKKLTWVSRVQTKFTSSKQNYKFVFPQHSILCPHPWFTSWP